MRDAVSIVTNLVGAAPVTHSKVTSKDGYGQDIGVTKRAEHRLAPAQKHGQRLVSCGACSQKWALVCRILNEHENNR